MSNTHRVSSLRLTAKNILLNAIADIPAERKIVVLDGSTVKIVDSICTLNDILDTGVYLVETVEKRRQPYPTMDAVYFISPANESATLIAKDFSEKIPTYKAIHLFFTREVTQSLFQMLATSPAGPVVKSFQEVWLEFVPFEARAFHVNMPGCQLLRPGAEGSPASMAELEILASRLVSLIVSLNELPQLKFRSSSGVCARLANLVQQGLDRYCSRNPGFHPVPGGDFLICDRGVDLVAPLLHEFTYQAMCQDLLPIHHGNRFDMKGGKTVALDENDSLWTGLRHCHIADCSKAIVGKFNQFLTENKAAVKSKTSASTGTSTKTSTSAGSNVSSLAEMKEAINALGEFQELKAQYSLHFTLAEECLNVFNKKKLVDVAGLEQNLVMGVDAEGKPVKDSWRTLLSLLARDALDSRDRLRLILIYLLTQPALSEADRKGLLDQARLTPEDLDSLRKMMLLSGDTNCMAPRKAKKAESFAYEVSRYQLRIKSILQDSIGGVLDSSAFSAVKGGNAATSASANTSSTANTSTAPVSLRHRTTATTTATSATTPTSSTTVPSRSIVMFVIGGMTFSEIRAAYEVAEQSKREVYIGSTHVITPNSFLDDIRGL